MATKKFQMDLDFITIMSELTNQDMNPESRWQGLEKLKVLVQRGAGVIKRRKIFLQKLVSMIEGSFSDIEAASILLPKLVEWNVIGEKIVQTLERLFKTGNEQVIEVILNSGIDFYISARRDYDLIAYLFDNTSVDVVKLLGRREFNVNARDREEDCALLKCGRRKSTKDVKFLLDRGAEIRYMIKRRRPDQTSTIMDFIWDEKCSELLLQYSHNLGLLFLVPFKGFYGTPDYDRWLLYIWAHAIVDEAQGIPLCVRCHVRSGHIYEFYDKKIKICREQVEWMKAQPLGESVTIFSVLTERLEKIAYCVRNEQTVLSTLLRCKNIGLISPYFSKIEKNMNEALEIHILRRSAAPLVSEAMQFSDPNNIVIDKIISFMTYQDLLTLCS